MKVTTKKILVFIAALFVQFYCYAANKTYDIRTAVSQAQMDFIALQYLNKLPMDNIQISNVNYTGSYILNDLNQILTIHFNTIAFTATATSDAGDSLTVTIQGRVSASIPKSDCSKSAVTAVDVKITHPLFNLVPQRDELFRYANVFIRDYIISQTNLINYCVIKPKMIFDFME